MAVTDYSTDPNQNGSIGGINVAEGCPAANLNNALRVMAADIRVFYNGVPSTANLVAKTGGVFTGNPVYDGRGGYMHNNDAASSGGRWFVQNGGTPSAAGMVNGDWLAVLT